MNDDLLTTDELAEVLKVPKSWVYSRTRETGESSIPCLMVGKYYRFRLSDILAWLEEKQHNRREV